MLKYKLKLCEYGRGKNNFNNNSVYIVKVKVKICECKKKNNNFHTKLVQKTSQLTTEFVSLLTNRIPVGMRLQIRTC